MSTSDKVLRLHTALLQSGEVVNGLKHRLIDALAEHGRSHPLVLQLRAELHDANLKRDAALSKFSDARIDELHAQHRKASRRAITA
jgi:hypothetical protein